MTGHTDLVKYPTVEYFPMTVVICDKIAVFIYFSFINEQLNTFYTV